MPVPSLVTDLSATIASNSPAGSDNVFPDLDNYLRALSGFLASIRDNSGNGWVSPYATAANPSYTGTLTGGTGVVNLGSGQFIKDASGSVLIGKAAATNNEKLGIKGTGAAAVPTLLTDLAGALVLVESNKAGTGYGAFGYQDTGGGGAALVLGRGTSFDTQMLFYTNPAGNTTPGAMSERARINSVGDFLFATTAGSCPNGGFSVLPNNGGAGISQIFVGHITGAASGTGYAAWTLAGTTIGSITQSGTTAVLYNTTSDQRLKTNIVDAPDASALIDSIKVRSFDWIGDDSHQRYGMVAQELFEVAPEAVHAPAAPDAMMAVDYSKLVPMLVKEIQSLRARVAALEA